MTRILILQHLEWEGPGILEDEIRKLQYQVDHRHLYMKDSVPDPEQVTDYDALLVMGGDMSVHEAGRYPFLAKEVALLKAALKKKIPVLGICLGAQLLALATGVEVSTGQHKEIGWAPIQRNPDLTFRSPVLSEIPENLMAFHWHEDTFDIPAEGYRLAGSALYPNQAFCINGNAYGLQFHIEMTEPMIRDWVERNKKELSLMGPGLSQQILDETGPHLGTLQEWGRKIFAKFVTLIRHTDAKSLPPLPAPEKPATLHEGP